MFEDDPSVDPPKREPPTAGCAAELAFALPNSGAAVVVFVFPAVPNRLSVGLEGWEGAVPKSEGVACDVVFAKSDVD
jgi:hypothetical protein